MSYSSDFYRYASCTQASKNLDEMRDIAARICRDYLTGAWKAITADDIQLQRIR